MTKSNIFLVTLVVVLISNCTKEIDLPTPFNELAQFPNEIGNKWVYHYTNDALQIDDTMSIEIVGEMINTEGDTIKLWERSIATFENDFRDTFWVSQVQDSIIFYPYAQSSWREITFILPLNVGQTWEEGLTNGSVEEEVIETVPAGNFEAFKVKFEAIGPNYGLLDQKWFTPNVGIIKWVRSERNLGPVITETYELVRVE